EMAAAGEVGPGPSGPRRAFLLRGGRIAVPGQIDDPQGVSAAEKYELLRAAGRVRGPRQRVPPGQSVDEARLADIGASSECDLGAHARGRRHGVDRARGRDEP